MDAGPISEGATSRLPWLWPTLSNGPRQRRFFWINRSGFRREPTVHFLQCESYRDDVGRFTGIPVTVGGG